MCIKNTILSCQIGDKMSEISLAGVSHMWVLSMAGPGTHSL